MEMKPILVFVSIIVAVNTQDYSFMNSGKKKSCQSSMNDFEVCVPIRECDDLYYLIRKPTRSEAEIELLRGLHCGFHGDIPKVCCSNLDTRSLVRDTIPDEDISTSTSQISLLPNISICGDYYAHRIFGGRATSLEEFPWMALIIQEFPSGGRSYRCGGVLINKKYILTAAHCMTKANASENWKLAAVRLGEYNKDSDEDCIMNNKFIKECQKTPPITVDVEKIIPHERYSAEDINQRNDIGLLRLKNEVVYTDYIKPICLPILDIIRNRDYTNKKLTVAGWGLTEKNFSSSIKLKVEVPADPIEECKIKFKTFPREITDKQMCAGGEKIKNSCMGDSGGPLMVVDSEGPRKLQNWYAAGIVSYGTNPCGLEDWPSVYTRVSKYVGWILRHMKP